jgi:hypothetical protein
VETTSRQRQRDAHLRAARWSIPLCLAGSVVTRLVFRDQGNFGLLSFALPIALGVLVGIPAGVRTFRRELGATFGDVRAGAGRPPDDEESARAMLNSGIPWAARAIERARADESLRQRVAKAVQLWDTLEQLGGDVSMSLDDLVRRPGELRRRLGDAEAVVKRGAARQTVGRQFEAALAEIAEEVARAEGRPELADECQAAIYLAFFDVAEQLGM